MHKRNSKTQGTILFHNRCASNANQSIAAFIQTLDIKLQEQVDLQNRQYNFDFEQGIPQVSDEVTSSNSSAYNWEVLNSQNQHEKETQHTSEAMSTVDHSEGSSQFDGGLEDFHFTNNLKKQYDTIQNVLGQRKVSQTSLPTMDNDRSIDSQLVASIRRAMAENNPPLSERSCSEARYRRNLTLQFKINKQISRAI